MLVQTNWIKEFYDPTFVPPPPPRVYHAVYYEPGEIHALIFGLVLDGVGTSEDMAARVFRSKDHVNNTLHELWQAGYIEFDWIVQRNGVKAKFWRGK